MKKNIYNVKPGLTGIGSIVFRDEEEILSNSKTDLEWAQLIKNFVYQIKNNANFDFKDYIK